MLSIKQEIKKLIQKYNNENETIKISYTEIKNQKSKIKELEKFAINLKKESQKEYTNDLQKLINKIKKQETRKEEYTNNLQTLISEIENQELKKEEYTNNLQTLISEIENQELKKEEYTNNLQTLRDNVLELKEKKKEKEIKSLSKNLQNKITEKEKYLKSLDIEIKSQKEKSEKYQKKLERLTSEIQNQVEIKEKFEQKIKKWESDILNFKNNQDELQDQLAKIEKLSIINTQTINFERIVEIEQLRINIDLQKQKILNQSEQSFKTQESIQNDQKILNLCSIIIELKNIKNTLKHSTNNEELEASIATLAVENNVNPKENKKGWSIRGFFKPLTNFIWNKKQKLTLNYYQKQEKRLTTEIRKLEGGKLKDFWNKFWLVISCGCYNNHGKVERKIKEKQLELAEVKKQLAKFNVVVDNENNYQEPQPSTSLTTTNKNKTWNNKIKKEIENISLPKEKSKNLSFTLN